MKKLIKSNIILFMLFGLLLSSCSTNNYDKLYRKGEKCLKNQDYVQAIENFEQAADLDKTSEDSYIALFDAYMLNGQAFEAVSCIDRSLKNTSGERTRELIADLNDGYELLDQNNNLVANIMVKYQERDYTQPKEPDGISRSYFQGLMGSSYDTPKAIKLSFDNYTILELNDQNKIVKIYDPSVKVNEYGDAHLVEIPNCDTWKTYEVETYDNGNIKFVSSKNNPDNYGRYRESTYDQNGLMTSHIVTYFIGEKENGVMTDSIDTYTYDEKNRLIINTVEDYNSIVTYTYNYEGDHLKTVDRSVKLYYNEAEEDLVAQMLAEDKVSEEMLTVFNKIIERKQNNQCLQENQKHTELRNDGLIISEVYKEDATLMSYNYFDYVDNRLVHYQGYNRYYDTNEEETFVYNEDGYIKKIDILSPGNFNFGVDYITYEYDENYENVTKKEYGHDGNVLKEEVYNDKDGNVLKDRIYTNKIIDD